MDIVNSFKDDFKLFKYTQKVARVFQVIPVVLYYFPPFSYASLEG